MDKPERDWRNMTHEEWSEAETERRKKLDSSKSISWNAKVMANQICEDIIDDIMSKYTDKEIVDMIDNCEVVICSDDEDLT